MKIKIKNITDFLIIQLFLLIAILNAISCGKGEYQLNARDKMMVEVLADVHVAEAGMEAIPDKSVKDSLANVWYGQIFTIHHIKNADFEQYMDELSQDTDRLNAVYKAVAEELKKQGK